jgi:hypothetical protein
VLAKSNWRTSQARYRALAGSGLGVLIWSLGRYARL